MALTKITCPHCKSDLKPPKPVPEGTRLKCPRCKQGFTAGQIEEDDLVIRLVDDDPPKKEAGIVEQPDSPGEKKKKTVADAIDVIDILEDDDPPVKQKGKEPPKKSSPEKKAEKKLDKLLDKANEVNDEDDPGGTYSVAESEDDHKEEDLPRGKKGKKKKITDATEYGAETATKDPRGPAQEKVIQCTNYMLFSAIIGFFGYMGMIIVIMIPAVTPLATDQGTKDAPVEVLNIQGGLGGASAAIDPGFSQQKAEKEEKIKPSIFTLFDIDMAQFSYFGLLNFILILLPLVLGMVYSAFVAYGSVQTQSLESRPWGIAASIMTILCYHAGGVILLAMYAVEILFIGILDTEKEGVRPIQYGLMGSFILAEILVGVYVLVTLLQEDVKAGFEYKPE